MPKMKNLQNYKGKRISQNLTILPVGTENLGKLMQIARILHDLWWQWANWADFVQFALNFEIFNFRGPNRKMAGEICIICPKHELPLILTILLMGTENLGKLMQIAQILCDLLWQWANWADFAQFAVNFESSNFRGPNQKMAGEICVICPKCELPLILAILLVGTENFGKLTQIAQILHDLWWQWANWADFAQFAVNFESSIFRGPNWKMDGEFCIICQDFGLFGNLGGIHGFLICKCMHEWRGFCVIHNVTTIQLLAKFQWLSRIQVLVAWSPILNGSVPGWPLGLRLDVSLGEVTRHLMVPCCMLSCYPRTYYHGCLSIASTWPEFDLVTSFLISVFTQL